MANCCDYEIRVKGSKKAGLMVYESMPCMDFKDLNRAEKLVNIYQVCFTGNCKWPVNYNVNDYLPQVDLDSMSESDIKDKGADYWGYSLKAKSEAFQCEIMVHYWSEESGFDQFDHYKNGKFVKQRKIAYNYEQNNIFDWEKTEFVGHEGEYAESVDGEQQNEKFMAMRMELDGIRSSDIWDKNQEKPADLGQSAELLGQSEAGIYIDNGSMGDTGFDIYKWTFTEAKSVKGNGWSIAIPDGFVQIKSNDIEPITGKKRLFELVPVTCKDEKDYSKILVRILPGDEQDGTGFGDNWMVHPNARAGIAGVLGLATAQFTTKMMGQAPGILSVGWSDVAAYILVLDTSDGSYSYQCTIITEKKNYMLRVQTQFMTDIQKHNLDISVQEWLKTMRFDNPNKVCPIRTKFENKACIVETRKGNTAKVEEAVTQAWTEYSAAVVGKLKCLKFLKENNLLDKYSGETIKEILEDGMAVKLFFLQKANQLIDRLRQEVVQSSILEDVIQILSDLDNDYIEYNFNNEKIKIDVPKSIQDIRNKWKKLAPNASGAESKEIRARQKAIAERKKAKEERKKADKRASQIAFNIGIEMGSIRVKYQDIVRLHKKIIGLYPYGNSWDTAIHKCFSKFDDDIQILGSHTEKLIMKAIDSYNEVSTSATPKAVISIIDQIERAINYVDNASVYNNLNVPFKYNWKINIRELSRKLKEIKLELNKRQTALDKEEKKQEKEDRRFEEALKYGVAEKDLNKYKIYLSAKKEYQTATKSKDFDAVSKKFAGIKGYLDADLMKTECDEKSKKLKPIEKAKKELDEASKRYDHAKGTLKECEDAHKNAIALRNNVSSDLNSKKESYAKDKSSVESVADSVIADLESRILDTEQKLSSSKRDLNNSRDALSKTFALLFDKKKKLRNQISEIGAIVSDLTVSSNDLKSKLDNAKNDKIMALNKLDEELSNLEKSENKLKVEEEAAKKKFEEAKKACEKAKIDFQAKKNFYDDVKRTKEFDAGNKKNTEQSNLEV